MKFGAHTSIAGGIWTALERANKIGCEVVQLFVKNNMQWTARHYTSSEVSKYFDALKTYEFFKIFAHSGYLINLAAPSSVNREKSIASLILEINLADTIELPFIVMHPGAHLGRGEHEGIKNASSALKQVFKETKRTKVRIALECTAGQGTCLGNRLEHIAEIYDIVGQTDRLGVCLDTAHLFQSGYDIRSRKVWDNLLKEIDKLIGINQVLAIHLNDSKTELGSRVDRHEHIGKGKIGLNAFKHIVNEAVFDDLPGCLETPKSPDLHEDVENLKVLRSLVERG